MKKIIFAMALAAASVLSLSAAELKLPVLWKANSAKAPGKYQTLAFAYLADKDVVYFAIQVNDLQELAKKPVPTMACYFNTDNDRMTGRFPKACGWDMQFNIRITPAGTEIIRWVGNKPTAIRGAKGEISTRVAGDVLLITVKKALLKDFKFAEKFEIRNFQGYKNCKETILGIIHNSVSPAKKFGELVIKE